MKANTNEYLMKEARKALAKQGGEATKKKHGVEHYKAMSAKGVASRKEKKAKEMYRANAEAIAKRYKEEAGDFDYNT